MGSMMGESDRKRRHFSSLSPTAIVAPTKNLPILPISLDKKLDIAILQFQCQKLTQKLDTQKLEYTALENKFSQLKVRQQPYDSTLAVVKKSWEQLNNDLELFSEHARESSSKLDSKYSSITGDGSPSTAQDIFLSRLLQTGATESSSTYNFATQLEENRKITPEKAKSTLKNIMTTINNFWCLKDGLHTAVLKKLPGVVSCRQNPSIDLEEVRNLRLTFSELHLKHKSLACELLFHRDLAAKNKADLKRLKGELESTVAELEESNHRLATLEEEGEGAKGVVLPVLSVGSTQVAGVKARDKQKDLHDMESNLKELLDQVSSRLVELKSLHEERIRILQQLCDLQNSLKNLKCITSSRAFQLVRDQIEKSKSGVLEYQALFEKLQVEKDNLAWSEREWYIKNDIADIFQRSIAVSDSRVADLRAEIQKMIHERNMIENKLKEEAREPGRKQVIAVFKSLVSSFPKEMESMETELSKYKESASDIHSLRADLASLASISERKVKECDNLSVRSAGQLAEINRLHAVVRDLRMIEQQDNLFLEMFKYESTGSRDVLEAREAEYKARALVQMLTSSLDEHKLELLVKTAIEAEARSQQRLSATEAEIADMRQKIEASKREMSTLSGVLKSKNKENEAYLSEVESIGQAYGDMQTQNQQLLQQITERDDYNIKLVLEGLRARQNLDSLVREKQAVEHEIQQANVSLNLYDKKSARIEEQLKYCSDQIQRLGEDKLQSSTTLEFTQRRLSDVRRTCQQARDTLDEVQSKVSSSRVTRMELQVEHEKERFSKKRIEEELEAARRKFSLLKAQNEGSSLIEKLQNELQEYREIVKCTICKVRTKQVVITKCFHLFCNSCVQTVAGSRHRKCPQCGTSFGSNDVKPVYM
ncbi:putative aminoacyltransferase, E1 ubiquitin-activating enzyme [Lupinus albus]|uniref:E3 ubiquitin protein ligase n=1 Tax=Lupinus albus TaxID=3870 RepID=A0A6A4NET6_LUPAL|nr:putative aminoacyltransferase, E1 ubiquitin-activating enzyme [Lupinus albus]